MSAKGYSRGRAAYWRCGGTWALSNGLGFGLLGEVRPMSFLLCVLGGDGATCIARRAIGNAVMSEGMLFYRFGRIEVTFEALAGRSGNLEPPGRFGLCRFSSFQKLFGHADLFLRSSLLREVSFCDE